MNSLGDCGFELYALDELCPWFFVLNLLQIVNHVNDFVMLSSVNTGIFVVQRSNHKSTEFASCWCWLIRSV